MQECRKALKSEGPQRLNMVDLYGKNVIPMEKKVKFVCQVQKDAHHVQSIRSFQTLTASS